MLKDTPYSNTPISTDERVLLFKEEEKAEANFFKANSLTLKNGVNNQTEVQRIGRVSLSTDYHVCIFFQHYYGLVKIFN